LGRRNRCAQAEFLGTDLLANRLVKRVLKWIGIGYERQSKVLEIETLASYFVSLAFANLLILWLPSLRKNPSVFLPEMQMFDVFSVKWNSRHARKRYSRTTSSTSSSSLASIAMELISRNTSAASNQEFRTVSMDSSNSDNAPPLQ